MTDPIEEAEALLRAWPLQPAPIEAVNAVRALIAAARADRDALALANASIAFERVTIAELRMEAHQLRTNLHLERIALAEAESKLAAVTAEALTDNERMKIAACMRACDSIFKDYAPAEIDGLTASVRAAWRAGQMANEGDE